MFTLLLLQPHWATVLLVPDQILLDLGCVLAAQWTGEGPGVGLYPGSQQEQVLGLQAGEAGRARLGWQGTGAG